MKIRPKKNIGTKMNQQLVMTVNQKGKILMWTKKMSGKLEVSTESNKALRRQMYASTSI